MRPDAPAVQEFQFDVFLSHSSADKVRVRALAEALRGAGLRVWLDEDSVPPGGHIGLALQEGLRSSRKLVLCLSPAAIESDWVNWETWVPLFQDPLNRELRVIPVFLASCAVPASLKPYKYLDFREEDPTQLAMLIEACRPPGVPQGERPSPALEAEVERYRGWCLERYSSVDLIGLGAGKLKLSLDQIYVPLRLSGRRHSGPEEEAFGPKPGLEAQGGPGSEELELPELFRSLPQGCRHALLVGEPGSGKSTALRKLLFHLWHEEPGAPGLARSTVPFLVRLRRHGREVLAGDEEPVELVVRELAEVPGGAEFVDLAKQLWASGRVLLLLDGLDEAGDEALRKRFCAYLERQLPSPEGRDRRAALFTSGPERAGRGAQDPARQNRVVVSCRRASLEGTAALGAAFASFELRPLAAEQVSELVRCWFGAVARAGTGRSAVELAERAEKLILDLQRPTYSVQRIQALVSWPLLLTLLCVVVLDGGAIPERRGEFFERCLAVLLRQWGEAEGRAEPALPLEAARRLLKPLAWELHRAGRQDGLSLVEVANKLDEQGRPEEAQEVVEWLHREAGLLQPTGSFEYGFSHLALQEYLAALEVGDRRAELLPELARLWAESWWREVILLAAGVGGSAQFAELVAVLLGPPLLEREEGRALLRDCLAEAAEVELAPFLALLDGEAEPRHKADVLRLLLGRREPALLERARVLSSSDHEDLQALCLRLLEHALRERSSGGEPCEVLVLLPRPEGSASELLAGVQACRREVRVVRADGAWQGQLKQIQAETREVWLAVAQGHPSPWGEKLERTLLGILARDECRLVVVGQPGEGLPEGWPQGLPAPERPAEPPWLEPALSPEPVVRGQRIQPEPPQPTPGQPWTEPTTGIRLLWVPPGEFSMGSNEISESEHPVHRVELSGFWLAETPVTNRQYGLYLEAGQGKVEEPRWWRDRRFSNPEQPVVGVSWEEARAFCRWLAGLAKQPVELPTEAEWEYAASGPSGWIYPWGNEPEPTEALACFVVGSRVAAPARVGSCPSGRAPFGHLDLAGNVWEWCEDHSGPEVADSATPTTRPAQEKVESQLDCHVLRGGSWANSAELLRSKFRLWAGSWDRANRFGFRVAVQPQATSTLNSHLGSYPGFPTAKGLSPHRLSKCFAGRPGPQPSSRSAGSPLAALA